MTAVDSDQKFEKVFDLLRTLLDRIDNLEHNLAVSRPKEAYTVEEAAERLNRRPWTVRQWCNKGQVPGAQKIHGKGRTGEWRIPHDSLVKVQKEGPTSTRQVAATQTF